MIVTCIGKQAENRQFATRHEKDAIESDRRKPMVNKTESWFRPLSLSLSRYKVSISSGRGSSLVTFCRFCLGNRGASGLVLVCPSVVTIRNRDRRIPGLLLLVLFVTVFSSLRSHNHEGSVNSRLGSVPGTRTIGIGDKK